jgi:photosystem II stability/assembly factor-like uncharacterized protein
LFSTIAAPAQEWQMLAGDLYRATMRDASTVVVVGDLGRILVGTDGGRTWSLRESTTTLRLTSVAFGEPRTGIAVGYQGVILRTTDGGASWRRVSDTGTSSLIDVHALSSSEYIAAGSGGKVIRSTDAGLHWSAVPTPTAAGLFAIAFRSERSAVVVGDAGTVLLSDDGGASWRKGPVLDPVTFRACAFSDSLHGVAVGAQGAIEVTADGGRSWSPAIGTPDIDGLRSVLFASKDTVIAGGFSRGGSKLIRSVDGGRSWTFAEPPGLQKYGGILGLTGGGAREAIVAVGADNLILSTTDRGSSWETISSMPTTTVGPDGQVVIIQVGWADSLHLFATGDPGYSVRGGWVYASSDAGATWRGTQVDTYDEMRGLIVVSKDTLIVGSYPNQQIYTSTDGGRSWTSSFALLFPYHRNFNFGEILMVTDSIGYTHWADSLVWRTTDQGRNWYGYPFETRFPNMFPVRESFPTPAIGYAVGHGYDVIDHTDQGYVVKTYGGIYKSVDSGKSWTSQIDHTIPWMSDIYFRGPLLGLACGDSGVILRTVDGGEHWENVFTQDSIYTIGDVRLIDDTLGIAFGLGRGGGLAYLVTRDAGRTWRSSDALAGSWTSSRGAGGSIFIRDASHVYVASTNQILKWSGTLGSGEAVVEERLRRAEPASAVTAIPRAGCTLLDVDWSTLGRRAVRITIYDLLGRPVLSERAVSDLQRLALDITRLAAGNYFLAVDGEEGGRGEGRFTVVR